MLNYEQFNNPIPRQNSLTHISTHTQNFKAIETKFAWLGLFLKLKLYCIPCSTCHCVIHQDFFYLKLENNLMFWGLQSGDHREVREIIFSAFYTSHKIGSKNLCYLILGTLVDLVCHCLSPFSELLYEIYLQLILNCLYRCVMSLKGFI